MSGKDLIEQLKRYENTTASRLVTNQDRNEEGELEEVSQHEDPSSNLRMNLHSSLTNTTGDERIDSEDDDESGEEDYSLKMVLPMNLLYKR